MSESKIITVIIPTFSRRNPLFETITSVKNALDFSNIEYRIVIVDNNIDQLNTDYVITISKNLNCEYIKTNINGPCHARNLATLKFSDSVYYSFLDDDVFVYEDYFTTAIELFNNRSDIDIIIGRTLDSSPSIINFLLGPFKDPRNSKFSIDNLWHVSGGNFFAKNIVVKNIQFDENYTGYSYAEDIDYGYRAKKIGYKANYSPNIKMLHFSSESGRDAINVCLDKIIGFSYFWKKNFNYKFKIYYFIRIIFFVIKSSPINLKIFFEIILQTLDSSKDPKLLFDFKKSKRC